MSPAAERFDLVVIGAGAAGLTAAGGAAMFGLRVALVERARMGGECLNTGCVPSKALLAQAALARTLRAGGLGVAPAQGDVDFRAVRRGVEAAISAIAPHDSEERFTALGVNVVRGQARFLDRRTLLVDGRRLSAPRFVVATGSRPAVPAIEGIDRTPYLTNETLFEVDVRPEHLVVLGGGAVGVEMAQAFRRLGSAVTLVEAGRVLSGEDPEAAAVVVDRLAREGVEIVTGPAAQAVEPGPRGVRLHLDGGRTAEGTHLLLATGRRACTDGLGLEAAGVRVGPDGLWVDERGRTTNRRILAAGDCRAGPRFTHLAGQEGAAAAAQVALGLPLRRRRGPPPRVVFTDPELAQVGLTEAEARRDLARVRTVRADLADNDRALAEGETSGFVKLTLAGRKLVGATIVGRGAGEFALPWTLALEGGASPWRIANAVVPYPTRTEASKQAAFALYEPLVFNRWTRGWARLLARLRRG